MRVVFMGTPEFAVPSLRMLAEEHDVELVVTRPDAVRGRGRRLQPSPVKEAALELGIPVAEAARMDAQTAASVLAAGADVICVAAYGALLPDEVLESAPLGCVNVHASLLPRGRGAAPIQRAVLEGDERVGVSIMRLVSQMDAGPYCRQASIEVGEKPCSQVMGELAELGASELAQALRDMADGTARWTEQDPSQVTFAAKVTKSDMQLDPAATALVNRRRVQASLDAAPARLSVAGRGVRALEARVSDERVPQGALRVLRRRVLLGCADGSLELLRVKPDGKREMDASAWAAGLRGEGLSWDRP